MNILITGANGFLGSRLVHSLVDLNNILIIEKNTQNLVRLKDIKDKLQIFDVDDFDMDALFQKNIIDLIIHTATLYGKQDASDLVYETNVFFPILLVNTAIKYNVKRIINTDTVLNKNISLYSFTKSLFREFLYFNRDSIQVFNVRIEHMYGEMSGKENFVLSTIHKMLIGEASLDFTKGEQQRDFMHVSDVCDAMNIIVNSMAIINRRYSNFYISSGKPISIKNLVLMIKEYTKSNAKLNFGAIEYRKNEYMESKTNCKSLGMLGWYPKMELNEGIRILVENERKQINKTI